MVSAPDLIPLESLPAAERRRHRAASGHEALWQLLDTVTDPEIPALSLWDIGILQDVTVTDGRAVVTLTPTYAGCPAMGDIETRIRQVLTAAGHTGSEVVIRLLPAWTTDWLTREARQKLVAEGISAPAGAAATQDTVGCPRCGSLHVERISAFSGTACRALYRCCTCLEPFDHFKAI